jgi:hypothetical protein
MKNCNYCNEKKESTNKYNIYQNGNFLNSDNWLLCNDCLSSYIDECEKCGLLYFSENIDMSNWGYATPYNDSSIFKTIEKQDEIISIMESTFFCDNCISTWQLSNKNKHIVEMAM